MTRYIEGIQIYHSPIRSKYNSFPSFFRFKNYIKAEGEVMARSKNSNINLAKKFFIESLRHIYRSFIRKKGYLDGYYGLRAAINFGLYQGCISLYALLIRLSIVIK